MAGTITLTELFRVADPSELFAITDLDSQTTTINRLLTTIFEYADGSLLRKSVLQRPWLRDFSNSGDFDHSLRSFNEDANAMTIALIEHLEAYASTILFGGWQKNMSEHVEVWKNQPDFEQPLNGERLTITAEALIAALVDLKHDLQWHLVCQRVGKFALLAGCPKTFLNPFENIDALRTIAVRNSPDSREGKLLAEIEQLRKQVRDYEQRHQMQNRIVANLSHRYLLEHLPGPAPKNVSSTAQWQAFWTQALQQANQSTTHPLAILLQRFGNDKRMLAQIQKTGEGMYGTLSTNIHHFRGVYDIEPSQWDELPGAILQALSPINFHADGSVDWTLERARY